MSTPPVAHGSGDPGPYVITFAASFERMPLAVPFRHELDHFSAFRSHTIERGHDVFRLHVGYFESPDDARAALKVVRRHYTDAHIATAPRRNLGSLDDTGITEFTMARPPEARAAAAHAPARRPTGADAAPRASAARCDSALQRYAIQLDALAQAGATAGAADLEAFRGHTLYRVHVLLDGALHQALRLGFFPSVEAAQQVLAEIRDPYPRANLVPVSGREYARIRELGPRGAVAAIAPTSARVAEGASSGSFATDEDVCCEFGAHELPTSERGAGLQPRR